MNHLPRIFTLLGATLAIAATGCAAPETVQKTAAPTTAQTNLLADAQPILPTDSLGNLKLGEVLVTQINVTGQSFNRATRIQVPQTEGDSNKIQININNLAPVKQGDALIAILSARGKATKGAAQMMFMFERNQNPWTKSATQGLSLPVDGFTWRRFAIPFSSQENYATGEVMATLRLAFGEQNLEVADFQILNFGKGKTLVELQTLAAQLSPLGTVKIAINRNEKRQIMSALGGNFTGGYREAYGEPNDAVEQLTRKNLKPTHARLGVSLISWQPDENGEFKMNSKAAGMLKTAGEFARLKVPMVMSMWEAPKWMTTTIDGKNTLADERFDAAINAMATWLVRARDDHGATIDYVSFNEADYGVDLYFTPARMGAFIKKAVPEFRKRGLKTLWLAGDTANGGNCVAWTRPQLEDPILRPMLGPVSFHGWDALGATDATYEGIANMAKEFNRPVWCLEAGSDAQAWRIQPAVWPTWDLALKVAQSYLKTIGPARSEVLDYWTYRDDYPLASKEGQLYPALYVLQQFDAHFGKGTQIVGASSGHGDVTVISGLKPDGSTAVMLVNSGGNGTMQLSGLAPNARVQIVRSNAEAQNQNVPNTLRVGKDGTWKADLPMRSVTTLVVK